MEQGHADAIDELRVRICGLRRILAQSGAIDAVQRHLLFGHQVAGDRVRHGLRRLHAAAAEALDLNDVTLLTGKLRGQFVQISLPLRSKGRATRREFDVDRGHLLVLIQIADRTLQSIGARTCGGCRRLRRVGPVGCIRRMLVSRVAAIIALLMPAWARLSTSLMSFAFFACN